MKAPDRSRRGRAGRKSKEVSSDTLAFSYRNYWIFGAALASIVIGYVTLSKGSITLAPILLVAGYCVLVPLGFFVK